MDASIPSPRPPAVQLFHLADHAYGLPLLGCFAALYFIISQTVFLSYPVCHQSTVTDNETPVEGWLCSKPEAAFNLLATLIAVVGPRYHGCAPVPAHVQKPISGVPAVRSCSAACQRPNGDTEA